MKALFYPLTFLDVVMTSGGFEESNIANIVVILAAVIYCEISLRDYF